MNSNQLKIGVFDSGIGGFSILAEILKKLPFVDAFYISDDAFAPYGGKSNHIILERCKVLTDMLLEKGVTMIVVACNTATAVAINELRELYPQATFVGVEPYLNVLNQKERSSEIAKAAVITTPLTAKTERFTQLKERLDPEGQIVHYALPNLASIVEDIFYNGTSPENCKLLSEELSILKEQALSHLILGCTHYPLIKDLIESELDVKTVCPGPFVVNRIADLAGLATTDKSPLGKFYFYSTKSKSWEPKSSSFCHRRG